MDPLHVPQTLFCTNKVVIGVIHLPPLPGSPGWQGNMGYVLERGLQDAEALASGGIDGVIVENFGDVPFLKGPVGSETVAAMAVVTNQIRESIGLPVGVNVLRNDPSAALGVAYVTGGSFIRVNVHTGVVVSEQGVIEGSADATMRSRAFLKTNIKVFADVFVKHAVPLGDQKIEEAAKAVVQRGMADGLIVTGSFSGEVAAMDDVKAVRRVCSNAPIFVGSGVTEENIESYLSVADGVIIGTGLKYDQEVDKAVDVNRVARIMKIASTLKST